GWCALTAPFHPYWGNSGTDTSGPQISQRYVFCGTFRPLRALALRGTLPCGVRTFLGDYAAIARLPANLMILCSLAISAIGEAGGSEIPLVVSCSDDESAEGQRARNIDRPGRISLRIPCPPAPHKHPRPQTAAPWPLQRPGP